MSASLTTLRELPAGVASTADLLARLDGCFLAGFGRLGEPQTQALTQLARIFVSGLDGPGAALGQSVQKAVAALQRSEFAEPHFVALAAARATLQGAMHDALLAQVCTVLGRKAPLVAPELAPAPAPPSHHVVYLESVRHFLMELALAGFTQLDMDALLPFQATLEKLLAEPALVRQAALLSGFLGELLAAMPIAARTSVPVYRWVDLWSRAMLLAVRPPPTPRTQPVSGLLWPLGCDLHHHSNLVSVVVHGLLMPAGGVPQTVRTTISAFKVDVVMGYEMWRLFDGIYDKLTRALRERLPLQLQGMALQDTGDLLWDEAKATVGSGGDLFATAALHLVPGKELTRTPLLGTDRHPAQLAEPVLLTGYRVKAPTDAARAALPRAAKAPGQLMELHRLELGGSELPLAGLRTSAATGITDEHVRRSEQLIGLLRFDRGSWAVQPLALLIGKGAGKKPDVELAGTPPTTLKTKDDTLAILRERAGKLLRAKS